MQSGAVQRRFVLVDVLVSSEVFESLDHSSVLLAIKSRRACFLPLLALNSYVSNGLINA